MTINPSINQSIIESWLPPGVCYLLYSSLPLVSAPLYVHAASPCVAAVAPASPVTGPSGLRAGDLVTSLGGVTVHTREHRDNINRQSGIPT